MKYKNGIRSISLHEEIETAITTEGRKNKTIKTREG